jgi:hypothetical protein
MSLQGSRSGGSSMHPKVPDPMQSAKAGIVLWASLERSTPQSGRVAG